MHINTIEGAWKFAREHFCRINRTSIANFEGHLSEIIWRNRVRAAQQDVIVSFFSLVRKYYTLSTIQNLVIRQPLFDSWNARQTEDKIVRDNEDIETPDEHVDVAGPENPLLDPDQPKYPQLHTQQPMPDACRPTADAEHPTPDAQRPLHDAQRFTLDAPEMSPSCSTTHHGTSTLSEQTRPKRRVIPTISPPQRSTKKSLEKRTKRMPTYRHPPSCKKT